MPTNCILSEPILMRGGIKIKIGALIMQIAKILTAKMRETAGSRWTCFGVRVPRTLDYPTINLNRRKSVPHDHNIHPSQTDRQTDGHRDNNTTFRSKETHRALKFLLTNLLTSVPTCCKLRSAVPSVKAWR